MNSAKRGGVFYPHRQMEKVRILPGVGNQKAIQLLHLHHVRINGKHAKILCPQSHYQAACPYCEWELALRDKAQALRSGQQSPQGFTWEEVDRLADKYKATNYIGMEIILRKEDGKGGWLAGSVNGSKYYLLLAGGLKNPQYLQLKHAAQQWGDLSHLDSGRDMMLVSDQNTKGFWNIKNIVVDQQPSRAFTDKQDHMAILQEYGNLKRSLEARTPAGMSLYDFMKQIRDESVPGADDEETKGTGNDCFLAVKERIKASGQVVALDDVEEVL